MSKQAILLCPELFVAPGGIARVSRHYLQALSEFQGEAPITVIALNDAVITAAELASCQAHDAQGIAAGRSKLKCAWALWKASAGGASHVTCLHVAMAPLVKFLQRLRPQLSYDVVVHGIEVWRDLTQAQAEALRGARAIFSVSDYTRREVLKRQPELTAKIHFLPNALDPQFASDAAPAAPPAPPCLLSVSRLAVHDVGKGIDHLITALPAVREAIPGTTLRIVGEGVDRERLEDLAAALPEPAAVQFLGRVDDTSLKDEYARCTVFALPSCKEGFGLVYLEAMAAGRPCVVAQAGAAPEVIDAHSGIAAPYGDPGALADTLITALRRDWDPQLVQARAKTFSFPAFAHRWRSLCCPTP